MDRRKEQQGAGSDPRTITYGWIYGVRDVIVKQANTTFDGLYEMLEDMQDQWEAPDDPKLPPQDGWSLVCGRFRADMHPDPKRHGDGVNRWRKGELVEAMELLAIDIDGAKCSVDDIVELFQGFGVAFIWYTTWSYGHRNKAGQARLRLVFPWISPITVDEHDAAYAWMEGLLESFGVDSMDTACRNPDRLMFGPRPQAPDAHLEPEMGLVRGEWLDPQALPGPRGDHATVTLDAYKGRVAATARTPGERNDYGPDPHREVRLLSTTSFHREVKTMRSALGTHKRYTDSRNHTVVAYDDHNEWLRVIMSLHEWECTTFDKENGEAAPGLELAHEWSKKSAKYDAGALNARWATFGIYKPNKKTRGPGTIIQRARSQGWVQPRFGQDDGPARPVSVEEATVVHLDAYRAPEPEPEPEVDVDAELEHALEMIRSASGDDRERLRHDARMRITTVWADVDDQPDFRNKLVAALKDGGFNAPVRVSKAMIAELNAELATRTRPLVEDLWPDITAPEGLRLPRGYKVEADGSLHVESTDKDGCIKWERITSDALVITARLVDMFGGIKLRLMWRSKGRWTYHDIARGHALMARPLMERTLSKGLPASSDTDTKVVRYLEAFEALNIEYLAEAKVSAQMGWVDDERFLWGHTLLTKEGRITQDPRDPHDTWQDAAVSFDAADVGNQQLCDALGTQGNIEGWLQAVAPLEHFPHAALALYASLASPLLEVFDHERSIVLDYAGPSGCGKTTAQRIAASCWGQTRDAGRAVLMQTWDNTAVALERMSASLNHMPLILNDSNNTNMRPEQLGRVIYQLSNSQGRARGRRGDHALSQKLTWKCSVISSGESRLIDYASSKDGGAKARVLQLHGSPFGEDSQRDLVNTLRMALEKHFGHAGPAFIEGVLQRMSAEWLASYQAEYDATLKRLVDTHSKGRAGDHTFRLSKDLAMVHVAAMIAHEVLGLPWAYARAVEDVAGDLLAHAAEVNVSEAALAHVFDWCSTNIERFHGQREADASGTIRAPSSGWAGIWCSPNSAVPWATIDIIGSVLDDILARQGFQARSIRAEWAKKGWLHMTKEGKTARVKKVPKGSQRLRVVSIMRHAIEAICGAPNDESKPLANEDASAEPHGGEDIPF